MDEYPMKRVTFGELDRQDVAQYIHQFSQEAAAPRQNARAYMPYICFRECPDSMARETPERSAAGKSASAAQMRHTLDEWKSRYAALTRSFAAAAALVREELRPILPICPRLWNPPAKYETPSLPRYRS